MPTDSDLPFVPKKIHLAPVGFEVDRVAEPIIQMRGDHAVLLANLEEVDAASRFREQVQRRLRRAGISTETVRSPIFDLYSVSESILSYLRRHREDCLYFNASSGSKIQSLSGFIAASIARAEGIGVETYYAEPRRYSPTRGQPLSHGFSRAFTIPNLTVRTPDRICRTALELLESKALPKHELAVRLARLDLLDSNRLDANGRARDNAARVSLQASVDVKVVRPLLDWGFVSATRVGRHLRIGVTDEGRRALRLYRNAAESSSESSEGCV